MPYEIFHSKPGLVAEAFISATCESDAGGFQVKFYLGDRTEFNANLGDKLDTVSKYKAQRDPQM